MIFPSIGLPSIALLIFGPIFGPLYAIPALSVGALAVKALREKNLNAVLVYAAVGGGISAVLTGGIF